MHSYHQSLIEIPTASIDNVALSLTDLGMGFQIIHLHMGRFITKQLINFAFTAFINSIYSMELFKLAGMPSSLALAGNQAQRIHG